MLQLIITDSKGLFVFVDQRLGKVEFEIIVQNLLRYM